MVIHIELPKQWPLKIILIHPKAPFLKSKKLIIAADCSLLIRPNIHENYKKGIPVIIGCPLLENPDAIMRKLELILSNKEPKEIDVISMEVPCCQALHMMIQQLLAKIKESKHNIKHYIVRVFTGDIEVWKPGVVDESMIMLERIAHGHG